MESDTTFIGNYRIRYRGEPMVVPVDEQGKLHLPDGKTMQLSEEQFKLVKDRIRASHERETNAKPLMMPTQTEIAAIYQSENNVDKHADISGLPPVSPNGTGPVAEKTMATSVNSEKGEKNTTKVKAKETKKAEQEREKERKKAEREAATKQAEEKRLEKEKLREAKKAEKNGEVGKLSLVVTALASILITLVVMGGLFFYCVNSGFITINNSPRLNGFVIYDDSQQENSLEASMNTSSYTQQ